MKKIVTISRQFASGGSEIGKLVAEKLGYDCIDKEIIMNVAVESGLCREVVEKYDEYATTKNSFLYSIAVNGATDYYGGLSFANQVQVAQAKVIRDFADKGNCVIIGRGADHILSERDDCLNVFIHSDITLRAERALSRGDINGKNIEKILRDKDSKRRVYYRSFTSREWGACENYHISLDSGLLGIERCAEIIADIVRNS